MPQVPAIPRRSSHGGPYGSQTDSCCRSDEPLSASKVLPRGRTSQAHHRGDPQYRIPHRTHGTYPGRHPCGLLIPRAPESPPAPQTSGRLRFLFLPSSRAAPWSSAPVLKFHSASPKSDGFPLPPPVRYGCPGGNCSSFPAYTPSVSDHPPSSSMQTLSCAHPSSTDSACTAHVPKCARFHAPYCKKETLRHPPRRWLSPCFLSGFL